MWNIMLLFSMLSIFHNIFHLKKTKTMACYTLTHISSLNLLSSIRTVEAFNSRHDCNTTVINRFRTGIVSSFEVSY